MMLLGTRNAVYPAAIFFALSFGGCVRSPMGHYMGDWDHMMGYGGLFMWLILAIVVAVILYFIYARKNSVLPGGSKNESPIEVLKKRYAKGEITKEDFDRMKKDIEE